MTSADARPLPGREVLRWSSRPVGQTGLSQPAPADGAMGVGFPRLAVRDPRRLASRHPDSQTGSTATSRRRKFRPPTAPDETMHARRYGAGSRRDGRSRRRRRSSRRTRLTGPVRSKSLRSGAPRARARRPSDGRGNQLRKLPLVPIGVGWRDMAGSIQPFHLFRSQAPADRAQVFTELRLVPGADDYGADRRAL